MLSWCIVREIKAHEVVLTTRAVELWRQRPTRAARGRGVCGAGAPAVRPQHVEVRVEEKQQIHDVRKTRIHEDSQLAETRGTMNDAVKASSGHGRRDMDRKVASFVGTEGRSSHARAVKDVTLQDATESSSSGQTEKLHIQDKARENEMPRRRRRKPARTLRSRL